MSERAGLPGAAQPVPGLPNSFLPITIEGFSGLNTKQDRPAIKDSDLSWCDGWMPIAPNMLKVLPGTGPIFYTSGTPGDIVWFGFGNVGVQSYLFVLHTDGSMTAVTVFAGVATQIMPPGTITNPTSILGFSQWGSLYIIFSKDQTNGYWLWDGSSLFTSGTAGPIVDILDGGSGYTSVPGVSAIGGSGSGIVLTAQIDNGAVSLVTVNNPGSGYQVDDRLVVIFAGGNGTTTPIGTANISNGVITSTFLESGGSGYQSSGGVQTPRPSSLPTAPEAARLSSSTAWPAASSRRCKSCRAAAITRRRRSGSREAAALAPKRSLLSIKGSSPALQSRRPVQDFNRRPTVEFIGASAPAPSLLRRLELAARSLRFRCRLGARDTRTRR